MYTYIYVNILGTRNLEGSSCADVSASCFWSACAFEIWRSTRNPNTDTAGTGQKTEIRIQPKPNLRFGGQGRAVAGFGFGVSNVGFHQIFCL